MSHRIETETTKRHGPVMESTMRVRNDVENRVCSLRAAEILRRLWTLTVAFTLLLPGLAFAAAPYAVEMETGVPFQPLPIDPDAPVESPIFEGMGPDGIKEVLFYGSYPIVFPFPVSFFGETYTQGAYGEGFLTFGSRDETLCGERQLATGPACANGYSAASIGPIPRELFPNRLLAVWWNYHCPIKTQGWGEAPNRVFVIEGTCGGFAESFETQVWFREGSSAIEVVYGEMRDLDDIYETFNFVGLMSPVPEGGVEGYPGLPCSMPGSSCRLRDFPSNTRLTYSVPADLMVDSVQVPATGLPGLPLEVRAKVRNIGDAQAIGANVRFHLSERPNLGAGSVVLGEVPETFDLGIGEEVDVVFEATLPPDLVAGSYYIIAQADPYGAVPNDLNQENNVRPSPMILVGVKAPALLAASIEGPASITEGVPFSVSWRVENQGSAGAYEVPLGFFLSDDAEITLLDRSLATTQLSIDAFDESSGTIEVLIPEKIAAGVYYIGMIIDPDDILPAHFKEKRSERSEPLLVDGGELRVLTTFLPDAQVGKSWCIQLEAAGGDGIYQWAVGEGSSLPPGLGLEELPAGAREAGQAFATRLCGRPSAVGEFAFNLEVHSMDEIADRTFELPVVKDALPLEIGSFELPFATYLDSYEIALRGRGGEAPYRWSVVGGALPSGIMLRSDGLLLGVPATDGHFAFEVQLTDAAGNRAVGELELMVSSPNRLTCGARSLPSQGIGEPYDLFLNAAGGIKPLRWKSVETRRLPSNVGERAETLGSEPPPGIVLGTLGQVSGSPTEMGRFLWTVQVSDSAPRPAEDHCSIVVDVPMDRGLSISTRSLAPATSGVPYTASLQALGGEGALRWFVLDGGRLPDGLSLSSSGSIEGNPGHDQLGGERSRTFPFLVEVRDARNRRGVTPLSITVFSHEEDAPHPPSEAPEVLKTSGGCGAAAGGLGLWSVAAYGMWMLSRRRSRTDRGR